jgi:hypothetical protein
MNDMGDPSDDPRRQFLELLSSGTSVVWYSENGRERPILDYTLRLLGTTIDAIGITPHGFAVLPDSSVVLVRLRGPRGGAVTVTPISQAGLSRVNSARTPATRPTRVRGGSPASASIPIGRVRPSSNSSTAPRSSTPRGSEPRRPSPWREFQGADCPEGGDHFAGQ